MSVKTNHTIYCFSKPAEWMSCATSVFNSFTGFYQMVYFLALMDCAAYNQIKNKDISLHFFFLSLSLLTSQKTISTCQGQILKKKKTCK